VVAVEWVQVLAPVARVAFVGTVAIAAVVGWEAAGLVVVVGGAAAVVAVGWAVAVVAVVGWVGVARGWLLWDWPSCPWGDWRGKGRAWGHLLLLLWGLLLDTGHGLTLGLVSTTCQEVVYGKSCQCPLEDVIILGDDGEWDSKLTDLWVSRCGCVGSDHSSQELHSEVVKLF